MSNFVVFIGIMIALVGVLFPLTPPETENERAARAVRAFFKAYADDTQVSYTRPKDDGRTDWVIDVRSTSNRNRAYTAVPTELLLKLSDETGVTTPWPDIIVDATPPAHDKGEHQP